MIKNIIAILLLGILLVAGCTQVPPNDNGNNGFQEKEISFETIDKDLNSNLEEKNNYIIQNKEEFQLLWDKIGSLKLLDDIDFSKYTVIAVAQGQKTSGGYSIEITKIIEKEDSILVSIKEVEAGPGQAAAVMTSPYHIVRIPKTNKLIKFETTTQESDNTDSSETNFKEINLNKEFTLEVGEQAILKEDDLRIKFLEVVQDSRCPANVKCVMAGSIKIKIDARYDNEKNLGQYELELGDNYEIDASIDLIPQKYKDELSSPVAHRIEFVKAETGSAETLDLREFTATFKVTEAFTQ